MKKKLFAVLLAAGLTISMGTNTLAVTVGQLKSEKAKAVQQKNKYLDSYKGKQAKIEKMESSIEKMDEQIEGILDEINKNKVDIKKYESSIAAVQKSIDVEKEKLEQQQELLDERMSAAYKNGSTGYLATILDSKSFSDLLARVEAISKIASYDRNLIKEHEETKQELQDKSAQLKEQEVALVKVKEANEEKASKFKEARAKQNKLIKKEKVAAKGFDAKVEKYVTKIMSLDSQIKKKKAAAVKAQEVASRATTSNRTSYSRGDSDLPGNDGTANFSTDAVVQYAMQFMGIPYRWGGTTPDGFDCSGFTKYVYAHFGINLPRTSGAQSQFGTPVSVSDLQPGDLVFFGSPVHHVGMYVGNGCYIHSPQTGESIKISPLNRSDYAGARRVR